MDILKQVNAHPEYTTQGWLLHARWGGTIIPIMVHKRINGETKYVAEVLEPEDGSILDDTSKVKWAITAEEWAKVNGVGTTLGKKDENE